MVVRPLYQNTTFTCVGYGEKLQWIINGIDYERLPDLAGVNRSRHHLLEVLTIHLTLIFNGTEIQCKLRNGNEPQISLITLQGLQSLKG